MSKEEMKKEPGGTFDLNSFAAKNTAGTSGGKGKKKKSSKSSKKERTIRALLSIFLICVITGCIVIGSFVVYAFGFLDSTMDENLDQLKMNFTTIVYVQDSNNEWVEYQRLHGEENRVWVPYDPKKAKELNPEYTGIPQNLANAFVAIEDKRFFKHYGVDWKRTFSAFANMFLHFYSSNQGGSTITQQLVKNLTGDKTQSPSRKVREIMRARYLECTYSKDTILECYLNTISMANGLCGVEVAANFYFDKSVSELTLAECASLAAITKNPESFRPDIYPENNQKRRNTVLREMYGQGYISLEEYEEALSEELNIVADRANLNELQINSYFVDALIDDVVDGLQKEYNYDKTRAQNNFYNGGYKIYATLKPEIQESVDKVFTDEKYALKGADGTSLQGSITVMDYQGHIVGMAGGIGQKTENRSFNRATSAIRQPGSTMKPIAAYAPALENNLITYSTYIKDQKRTYGSWTAVNWYKSYWGNITVHYALERSVNTVPVHLVDTLTPQVSYDFLTTKLGVKTLNPEDCNLAPLGMGGTNGGLTTEESAAAFAIFGNGGRYYEPQTYYYVTDQYGTVVLKGNETPTIAISEDTATVMNHLLQNVVYGSNGTGTRAASFISGMKIYAKTGTSDSTNDLWFVGGTPYYIASCWCGYDSQQRIKNEGIALTLWGNVMKNVHSGYKAKEFTDSEYVSCRYYCTETGQLATNRCSSVSKGWYKNSYLPTCSVHGGTIRGPIKGNSDTETGENGVVKGEKTGIIVSAPSETSSETSASSEETPASSTPTGNNLFD